MSDRPNIDEIRARLSAATPGPWVRRKYAGDIDTVRQAQWVGCPEADHDDCAIAQTVHNIALVRLGHSPDRAIPDAEFIAHAPEDIAALLAYIEALEAQVEAHEDTRAGAERRANDSAAKQGFSTHIGGRDYVTT